MTGPAGSVPAELPPHAATPGVLTVYSDLACPWATLALFGLRRARAERGVEVRVDHRCFPLELVNRRPTPKAVLDAEIPVIAGLEPDLGWSPWRRREAEYPVTTLLALEAVQAAKAPEVGGLAASEQLDWALRCAFYRDSQCISLLPTILDVADSCELVDAAALRRALAAGAGRGAVLADAAVADTDAVPGSPYLIAADGRCWHNPGVASRWTAPHGRGFPLIDHYEPTVWTDLLPPT